MLDQSSPIGSRPTTIVDGNRTVLLRHLSCTQLVQLERFLDEVGEFGEVRLIIDRGRIKFVEVLSSRRL